MKNRLLCVLDGLADEPCKELGGKTPLEAAKTPNMDKLAKKGILGSSMVIGHGIAPESDSAVLTLLGYDYKKVYTGRGPLEALGIKVRINEGELALRCNFATSSNGKDITDRRVGRGLTSKEAKELAEYLEGKMDMFGCKITFKASKAHRAILVIKMSEKLSGNISNVDPAYEKIGDISSALEKFEMKVKKCVPLDKSEKAKKSADLVNEFTKQSFEILKDHPINKKRIAKGMLPANIILCRDAGHELPKMEPISKRDGCKWTIIADTPLELGIARAAHMPVYVELEEDESCNGFKKRAKLCEKAFEKYDCVYMHIKGPDIYGHDGDAKGKMKSIEMIDKCFFGNLDFNGVLCITADHSCICNIAAHGSGPVPVLFVGGDVKPDGINVFSDRKYSFKMKSVNIIEKLFSY